jgi:hypothetical protein
MIFMMLWNGSKENENVRSECKKMTALTVKIEKVILIGEGRSLTHFVSIFLADILFLGIILY